VSEEAALVEPTRPRRILPAIVFSQFAGTSLWFAGNAVLPDLSAIWGLSPAALGYVTSAVQFGFIMGTLVFAVMSISDIFSPRRVFLVCVLAGAACNIGIYLFGNGLVSLLLLRFLIGFFLAGIYPVGMKIATGWYREGLGRALGYLVGALVLGTAFPHLLKAIGHHLLWSDVILMVSAIAALGGIIMYVAVPDGPYVGKGTVFDPAALKIIFRSRGFRASAFGYFGHMWELYAFWAFVPLILASAGEGGLFTERDVSLWAFYIIGSGGIGCIAGGLLADKFGSARIAVAQLFLSGLCCLLSPLIIGLSPVLLLPFLLLWGITVVGDSPQFSTLNAVNAPKELIGSALTIANCIGFAITIVSIQLLSWLAGVIEVRWLFLFLIIGPILGLVAMRPLLASERPAR